MNFVQIPSDLGLAILNYLGERPYREVCHIVPALQSCPLVEARAPEADPAQAEQVLAA